MTAQQRKDQTEIILKEKNIPINVHLPLIEEENEAKIRTAEDIARRVLVLSYLYAFVYNKEDRVDIITFLEEENLWEYVSPDEKRLFLAVELTERDSIDISWRVECVYVMLWAINKIETLKWPTEETEGTFDLIPGYFEPGKEFVESATIRSTAEILDASDLIYRIHWAVRQAQFDNKDIPADLDSGVVSERHYAINWITFYEEDWDEITTDT